MAGVLNRRGAMELGDRG
ncbi:hypothetical protein LINPERHAP2_LOCUS42942 [Linum perenne]